MHVPVPPQAGGTETSELMGDWITSFGSRRSEPDMHQPTVLPCLQASVTYCFFDRDAHGARGFLSGGAPDPFAIVSADPSH